MMYEDITSHAVIVLQPTLHLFTPQ